MRKKIAPTLLIAAITAIVICIVILLSIEASKSSTNDKFEQIISSEIYKCSDFEIHRFDNKYALYSKHRESYYNEILDVWLVFSVRKTSKRKIVKIYESKVQGAIK